MQVAGVSISFPDETSFSVPGGASHLFRVRVNLNGDQVKNPLSPSMAASQVGNPRHYLAEVSGLVLVTPSSGPALRVPLYAAVRSAMDMHASQSSLAATAPGQTPMFFDLPGNGMTVTYDQASYQANGSLGLLLLHHYNQDGKRAEVVTVSPLLTVPQIPRGR